MKQMPEQIAEQIINEHINSHMNYKQINSKYDKHLHKPFFFFTEHPVFEKTEMLRHKENCSKEKANSISGHCQRHRWKYAFSKTKNGPVHKVMLGN